jgi:ankyrin repeat protein
LASRLVLALLLIASTLAAQDRAAADSFYQAIRNDDLPALAALVRTHGPAVTDSQGQTPLMIAAAYGSLEAVRLLLVRPGEGGADAGAGINAASNAGATALHLAVGDLRKVRLLLDRGAAVDVPSKTGRTPLLVAASAHGGAAVVELLLARGANIHQADAQGVTALIAAASVDDSATARLLLERGADPGARAAGTPQSATALMGAAYNGNEDMTRLLLARKPDVEARSAPQGATVKNGNVQFGNVTALHMAVVGANASVVSLLLNAGAAPDALDIRGMTPLMWAVATDRPNSKIVRLLLERGADVSIRSKADETVVDWARKFNDPDVLAALKLPRPDAHARVIRPAASHQPDAARTAVLRSMPLLREASDNMLPRGGCVACHAQPMTALAAQLAAGRGWAVEEKRADVEGALATMAANAPVFLQGREAGGLTDTGLYVTLMFAAQKVAAAPATDAFVHYLATKQRPSGQWRGIGATRAPIQDGDVSRTAMAIRALTTYAIPARRAEFESRVARAAAWLAAQSPRTTEDRVMQLLGLKWAGTHATDRTRRTRELAAAQHADGGWAQTAYLASDAYATGQALYALRELGLPTNNPALQRGAAFLVRTQQDDGSWYVKSRAMKIQPYFESGFPHGHDQWISQSATAWAAIGLAVTAR